MTNILFYMAKLKKHTTYYKIYLVVFLLLSEGCITFEHSNDGKMKIEQGDTIPNIILFDQNGKLFDLKRETTGKNVVLFFYPKDDSPGCTKEACSFRDQYEDFVKSNAVVIGISGQSVESHKKFTKKYNLSYTLLSDQGNKIRKIFGVPTNLLGLLPGRVTYIEDKNRQVVDIFNSQTQVHEHVKRAIETINQLN